VELESSAQAATAAIILIATEPGAEGVNLEFCSVVINFDLPWNPQRIEQRIGRCHRFGGEPGRRHPSDRPAGRAERRFAVLIDKRKGPVKV
jgi:superfamily II DNA/RNA helicase